MNYKFVDRFISHFVFRFNVNIAGLPGVSVPCGFNAKGMPIGMQLIGKSFGEAEILNAAYKYQQAAAENFKDTKWGVKL